MRVIVVGNTAWRWSAESDWVADFERLGWEVVPVYERATKSRLIVQQARNADLVLWVGGSRVHPPSVIRDCARHTFTAGVSTDLYWGLGRRGNWRDAPTFHADHVFTADGGSDELWQNHRINHHWLLPGVRKQWIGVKGTPRARFSCDVAFVGNNGSTYHDEWPYRTELVKQLAEMCYRNGWKFLNPGGHHSKVERNNRMNNFYASASVTVGDSLCFDGARSRYWSDRVYEATGRGGVLVMPRIDALAEQVPWMPTYEWGDWASLETIIASLLSNDEERAALKKKGRKWAATQTYEQRIAELLKVVGL